MTYLVVAASVAAAVTQAPLFAGRRIAPVTSACPAERPHREVDVDGVRDRCVARAEPECATGTEPRSDVTGEADVCVAGSTGVADTGKPPKCASGFRLLVAAGKDLCEKAGPPTCPSGFKLKAVKGRDQCHA